jgi:hypothetical protein
MQANAFSASVPAKNYTALAESAPMLRQRSSVSVNRKSTLRILSTGRFRLLGRLPLPILHAVLNIERYWRNGTLALTPIPAHFRLGSPYLLTEK